VCCSSSVEWVAFEHMREWLVRDVVYDEVGCFGCLVVVGDLDDVRVVDVVDCAGFAQEQVAQFRVVRGVGVE
jgi:hypothetical protein